MRFFFALLVIFIIYSYLLFCCYYVEIEVINVRTNAKMCALIGVQNLCI